MQTTQPSAQPLPLPPPPPLRAALQRSAQPARPQLATRPQATRAGGTRCAMRSPSLLLPGHAKRRAGLKALLDPQFLVCAGRHGGLELETGNGVGGARGWMGDDMRGRRNLWSTSSTSSASRWRCTVPQQLNGELRVSCGRGWRGGGAVPALAGWGARNPSPGHPGAHHGELAAGLGGRGGREVLLVVPVDGFRQLQGLPKASGSRGGEAQGKI